MRITVDDREIECKADETLLKSLLGAGIKIPSLCYHPALGADGRCGLCLVEIEQNGRWTPRLACQVKPVGGMQVKTETERILRMRSLSARLLLQHAPFPKQSAYTFLQEIAMQGGMEPEGADSSPGAGSGCILCGLCVRACAKTGRAGLGFSGKGEDLKIVAWSGHEACGRCAACIAICPTGFLNTETRNKILIEW